MSYTCLDQPLVEPDGRAAMKYFVQQIWALIAALQSVIPGNLHISELAVATAIVYVFIVLRK